ncbi:hypothetical protein Back2_19880 [Nocardioides baekrokdamisoli]|uniref:Type II secretion system protein GspF domain-containing protein n=1 Tax=Nocardioides baekrokdamisoli TaxID=1804624 RepID=A0A3G9IVJ4_9ACTN|nr:type II secretion system F family protein [Nocardioides baekrokdamisoli]BBH17701.1 hypothetical protein Back2_19880 [Nocardioides baekrokdamisoli]
MIVAVALLLGCAAALVPPPVVLSRHPARPWSIPFRPMGAAVGLFALIGGPWGLVTGMVAAVVIARRSRKEIGVQDPSWGGAAPVVVALIAAATRAGVAAPRAVGTAAGVLDPMHAADLVRVVERWRYGLSSVDIEVDRPTRLVARAIEQAQDSGAAPALALEHAATDLVAEDAARAQERARRVGVRAAVPLGVCLLPAFLCLGVAPLVASLMADLSR